ncbi:MAG: MFS transporter, partial [Armatimonadota bacterium]
MASEPQPTGVYRDTVWWNIGFSAYWFATSYKWFILLFVILPREAERIGGAQFKNTTWGTILGTGAVLAVILPPIFARMTETLGGQWSKRQNWIAAGVALTVIGCLVLMMSNTIWMLAVGFYLLQIGDQAGTASYAGMVADTVPAERRDFASGILGALKPAGQIASIVAAGVLQSFGFPVIIGAVAAVNVVCGLWTLWAIKGLPAIKPHHVNRGNLAHDWIEPFQSHDFRFVWLNRFVVALASAIIFSYSLNYLTDMFP